MITESLIEAALWDTEEFENDVDRVDFRDLISCHLEAITKRHIDQIDIDDEMLVLWNTLFPQQQIDAESPIHDVLCALFICYLDRPDLETSVLPDPVAALV